MERIGFESLQKIKVGNGATVVNPNLRDKGSASRLGAVNFRRFGVTKFLGREPYNSKLAHSSVGCLIEFVTMPFGWFSGPSKEAPSPQADISPTAKSRSTQCEMSNCRSSESGGNQALLCVSNYETETR